METKTNDEIIQELLEEFKSHRNAIMDMINDIEKLKAKIDKIIPDRLDARYVRFFEEKIKTATEFFKTLLEMRKEIQKSLKDEIELRRKVTIDDTIGDIDSILDIRKMVSKVEDFQKQKENIRKKTVEAARKATDVIGDEVQKMNAL